MYLFMSVSLGLGLGAGEKRQQMVTRDLFNAPLNLNAAQW